MKVEYDGWYDNARRIKPDGSTLEDMLSLFEISTGKDGEVVSFPGMTTASYYGGINFGPSMPGEVYTAHIPNEFKKVENLAMDIQLVTELILLLGNQDEVDLSSDLKLAQ